MPSDLPFPSIYLLTAHLAEDELRRLEEQIPSLTTDAGSADIFVGKLSRRERAQFELRRLGIATVDESRASAGITEAPTVPAAKRRRLGERTPSPIVISSSSSSEGEGAGQARYSLRGTQTKGHASHVLPSEPMVKVAKLAWFTESVARGEVLPLPGYLVYEGRRMQPAEPKSMTVQATDKSTPPVPPQARAASKAEGTSKRAQFDSMEPPGSLSSQRQRPHSSPLRQTRQQHDGPSRRKTFNTPVQPPSLFRTTTSEHDKTQTLPPIPEFLLTTYSCQRPTPVHPPNERFVDALKKIRVARQLTGDKIGIRAYSTAIATLSAYPYELSAPAEVSRLPGCGPKVAELFREFQNTDGHVREADDDEADSRLSVLRLFYNIWGVAEATARAFYNKGWRDLDDVVEFGWKELSRVQQIGVKYYDELQEPLTRKQVEAIADKVLAHANGIRPGYQMVVAGGYRRGKELSGDVDIILSHQDETATNLLVGRLVLSLEQDGLVTHTLTLSTANSERGQEAVSWKGNAPKHNLNTGATGGAGFDTLDKALVVWQEPMEENEVGNKEDESGAGNTNPHRRVDIIVSPWKTVGCAVLGWSSGTTFQRDLRRYCKYERGLRFDSSGARSRADGSWLDLEDFAHDPAPDMLAAERRVFAALGLEFRPPNERCTG